MDASLELLMAAVARLRSTPAIVAYVGPRIYDRVPQKADGTWIAQFPFISIGPTTVMPDDFDCVPSEEITIQFDVWSTATSGEGADSVMPRKIANLVKRALHNVDLTLTSNALVTLQHVMTRSVGDPNPAIYHYAVQFTATVETPGA